MQKCFTKSAIAHGFLITRKSENEQKNSFGFWSSSAKYPPKMAEGWVLRRDWVSRLRILHSMANRSSFNVEARSLRPLSWSWDYNLFPIVTEMTEFKHLPNSLEFSIFFVVVKIKYIYIFFFFFQPWQSVLLCSHPSRLERAAQLNIGIKFPSLWSFN